MKKARVFTEAFLLMIILQAIRELVEWGADALITNDSFVQRMITMGIMAVLTGSVVLYAKCNKTGLSVFPKHFGKAYIIVTCISALLLISTPSNFIGGYQAVMLLVYGSIVTPIYEELIFRGYLWNRLSSVLSKESYTYVWSIALFSIWHLGYMIPQLLSGNWFAVITKMVAGMGYGVILGGVRLKTKNCYSTMLVHGVLNIFMV